MTSINASLLWNLDSPPREPYRPAAVAHALITVQTLGTTAWLKQRSLALPQLTAPIGCSGRHRETEKANFHSNASRHGDPPCQDLTQLFLEMEQLGVAAFGALPLVPDTCSTIWLLQVGQVTLLRDSLHERKRSNLSPHFVQLNFSKGIYPPTFLYVTRHSP